MSFTCPDFYDEVCSAAVRAGLVNTDNLPEDESGIAIMADRFIEVLRVPPSPKSLTEPQERFLRTHFTRLVAVDVSEMNNRPEPCMMVGDMFRRARYLLKGGEVATCRQLVRDGFLREVGDYDVALTIKGRITVARLVLAAARANFIEIAKLANQEIA